jgi:hypothetical protein
VARPGAGAALTGCRTPRKVGGLDGARRKRRRAHGPVGCVRGEPAAGAKAVRSAKPVQPCGPSAACGRVEAWGQRGLESPGGWGLGRRPDKSRDFPQSGRREAPRTFDRGCVQPGNVKNAGAATGDKDPFNQIKPSSPSRPRVLYIPLGCWALLPSWSAPPPGSGTASAPVAAPPGPTASGRPGRPARERPKPFHSQRPRRLIHGGTSERA